MLLTMHIEIIDGNKRHMDEVIGEIEYDNDNAEVLRHLALKLRCALLSCNIYF